jgi:hypothetical protein
VCCIDSGQHSYCKTADRKEVKGARDAGKIEQEVREKDGVIDRERRHTKRDP